MTFSMSDLILFNLNIFETPIFIVICSRRQQNSIKFIMLSYLAIHKSQISNGFIFN